MNYRMKTITAAVVIITTTNFTSYENFIHLTITQNSDDRRRNIFIAAFKIY